MEKLHPDTTRHPLKKSKETDNIFDVLHVIMKQKTKQGGKHETGR
jgi:hypothetical protein